MAISFEKTSYAGKVPVFWRGDCKVLPAGYHINENQNFSKGAIIPAGTLVEIGANLTVTVLKAAVCLSGTTSTAFKVAKGHLFEVGDNIYHLKEQEGGCVPIESIDTSNADYDVIHINIDRFIDATEGSILAEVDPSVTEGINRLCLYPNAVVAADHVISDKLDTLDIAYEAIIINKNAPVPDALNELVNDGGICLEYNPNIITINQ